MSEIREVAEGETHRAAPALLELRPNAGPLDALISRVDVQRGGGYRIVGAFDEDEDEAAAVIGFRSPTTSSGAATSTSRTSSPAPTAAGEDTRRR